MDEVGSLHSMRPLLTEVGGVLFEALGDIGGNDTLFLNILNAPGGALALTLQALTFEAHGTCQGNGTPRISLSLQQDLWRGHQPTTTLGRPHEDNHHTGIALTGPEEEFLG